MVDAESILDLIPSKQKRWIPKLGDTNEANRFESWYPDKKGFLQQENRQNRNP
jgi:hypothetical protein